MINVTTKIIKYATVDAAKPQTNTSDMIARVIPLADIHGMFEHSYDQLGYITKHSQRRIHQALKRFQSTGAVQ